uniref:Uncharacterized protein n=1 Tax=Wuchereria bancrofti TaxID=6293 RepID=A0AAF5PII9_WUCBA
MITGSGDIDKLCQTNTKRLSRSVCVANLSSCSELETFWKLELMGINDQPNANDDEEALKQFKKSIIKCNGRYRVGIIHYLPHHGVLTPNKSTTKMRIVYDASAHLRDSKSLNEVLYRGPTLTGSRGCITTF